MKQFWGSVILGLILVLSSCQAKDELQTNDSGARSVSVAANKEEYSYAFGVQIGRNLQSTYLDLDMDALKRGISDVVEKQKGDFSVEKAGTIIDTAMKQARELLSERNEKEEQAFFEENGKKDGVITTESGLQYKVNKEGSGEKALENDLVKVNYTGYFLDGTEFETTKGRNEALEITVSKVISGWKEALQLMNAGSSYTLYIPAKLAYGDRGAGNKIGPKAALIFDIELVSIEGPAPEPSKNIIRLQPQAQ